MSEDICPICNVYQTDHDYEHMARTCYPQRIRILEVRIKAVEDAFHEVQSLEAKLKETESRCDMNYFNWESERDRAKILKAKLAMAQETIQWAYDNLTDSNCPHHAECDCGALRFRTILREIGEDGT